MNKFDVGSPVVWNWYPEGDFIPEKRDAVLVSVRGERCDLKYKGRVIPNILISNISICGGQGVLESEGGQVSLDVVTSKAYNVDMPGHTQFQVRLPEPYLEKLRVLASKYGVSVSTLIFQAVLEGLPLVMSKYSVVEDTPRSDNSN